MRVRFKGNMANAGADRLCGLMTARGAFTVPCLIMHGRLNPDRRNRKNDKVFEYVPSSLHWTSGVIAYRGRTVKREMRVIDKRDQCPLASPGHHLAV
jgi:hypothetical protein